MSTSDIYLLYQIHSLRRPSHSLTLFFLPFHPQTLLSQHLAQHSALLSSHAIHSTYPLPFSELCLHIIHTSPNHSDTQHPPLTLTASYHHSSFSYHHLIIHIHESKASTSSLPSIHSLRNLLLLLFLFIHSNHLDHTSQRPASFKCLLYPFFYIISLFSYCIPHSFISIPLFHVSRVLLLQYPSPLSSFDFHALFFSIPLLPHLGTPRTQISSSPYPAASFAH